MMGISPYSLNSLSASQAAFSCPLPPSITISLGSGASSSNSRLYLPQDELAAFNLTENDIAAKQIDQRWQEFIQFQISRIRQLYAEALPGVALLDWQSRLAIAAAAELYRAILEDIEANNYDVFNRRAYISGRDKLARLPGIAWRVATNRYA